MGKNDPLDNTLLCLVGEQFFYYGLLNAEGNIHKSDQIKINSDFSFYHSPETISTFLSNSLESLDFKKIKIGIVNQWFSIVPIELSKQESKYWTPKPKGDLKVDFHIDTLDQLQIAYFIPTELKNKLLSIHDDVSFHHLVSANLKGHETEEGVHSYKINGLQFLQVIDKQKIIYSNLVKSKTVLSQLYYSLLAFHVHEKDPHQIPFYTTTSESDLNQELSTYIKQVHNVTSSFKQTHESNLTNEYLYQLEKLDLCAS